MARNLSLIENNGTVYNICDQVARDQAATVSTQLTAAVVPIAGIKKIVAGTKVIIFANSASCQLFSDSEMNDLLEIDDCNNGNTAVAVSNGEFSANGNPTYNAFYANNAWHAHIGAVKTGQVRINYILVRF